MAVTASEAVKSIVTVSPDVMSGSAVFRGTRVPVKNLLDYLAEGNSLDEFLDQFPTVRREQAIGLIEVAEDLVLEAVREAARR